VQEQRGRGWSLLRADPLRTASGDTRRGLRGVRGPCKPWAEARRDSSVSAGQAGLGWLSPLLSNTAGPAAAGGERKTTRGQIQL